MNLIIRHLDNAATKSIHWAVSLWLRRPLSLKFEQPYEKLNFAFWWKITDYAFRFVQWCIVVGVIKFAADKSGSRTLSIISIVLSSMVLLTGLSLYNTRVTATLLIPWHRPRVSKYLSIAVSVGIAMVIAYVGNSIFTAVVHALETLQSMR